MTVGSNVWLTCRSQFICISDYTIESYLHLTSSAYVNARRSGRLPVLGKSLIPG